MEDQLYQELEQRYLLLKNERDAICVERDSYKGLFGMWLMSVCD
jgi:hypothetical protein